MSVENPRNENVALQQELSIATPEQTVQIQESFEACMRIVGRVSTEQVEGKPGIYTSASDKSFSNFGQEQWTRDGSFISKVDLELGDFAPVKAFLETKLKDQKPDGELPVKHEIMFHARRLAPGFRTLKTLGLDLLTRQEFTAVYGSEKQDDQTDSRDVAPIFTLAFCEYAKNSGDNEFVEKHY